MYCGMLGTHNTAISLNVHSLSLRLETVCNQSTTTVKPSDTLCRVISEYHRLNALDSTDLTVRNERYVCRFEVFDSHRLDTL